MPWPEPPRVLVVDDEPQVCEYVSRTLEIAGYRVTTAESGAAALAAVAKHGSPDLLLTDLKMPQMEGDELAARLRQASPDLKVLYFTGFSQTLFDNRGMLWEGEAFLEKPSSPAALLEGSRYYSSTALPRRPRRRDPGPQAFAHSWEASRRIHHDTRCEPTGAPAII